MNISTDCDTNLLSFHAAFIINTLAHPGPYTGFNTLLKKFSESKGQEKIFLSQPVTAQAKSK